MKDFNFIHDKTKHDKKLIQTILNQGNKKKKRFMIHHQLYLKATFFEYNKIKLLYIVKTRSGAVRIKIHNSCLPVRILIAK